MLLVCSLMVIRARVSSRFWRALLLTFCLQLCRCTAAAEFHIVTWTTENGLPQNSVIDTCQAPDGYLWLATLDGLVRFDGVRFVVFNRSNTAGILGNQFNSLYCSPSGEVWAGTESTGVTRYSHGTFQTYTRQQGLPPDQKVLVTGDKAGEVWMMTEEQIAQWKPAASRFVPLADVHGRQVAGTQGVYIERSNARGAISSANHGYLEIFSEGSFIRYPLPHEARWQAPVWVARDVNGTVWMADRRGRLRHLAQGQREWSEPLRPSAANREGRTSTYRDAFGESWRIIVDHELGGGLEQSLLLRSQGRLIDVPFNHIAEDREGSLWLSTNGQGLVRIRKQTVTVLSTQEGLPNGNVYPIYQDRTGDIWIGTRGGGPALYHDGRVVTLPEASGLNSTMVSALGEDRERVLWVGTLTGLYRGKNGDFERVYQNIVFGAVFVTAIYQDSAGPLWFGTSGGLLRLQGGRWTAFHKGDGLASDDVRVVLRGRSGDLWIGGYGGLTRLKSGRFEHWTEADGLPSNTIRSLYEDSQGVLWIGTYDGGLGRLKDGHLTRYNVNDGLFASGVFQILEDDSGYLWMSSNRGVYRVPKRELNLFAEGKLKSVSSVSYGKADGMRNAECNGGFSPAGIRTADGKLWFPTQDGVAIIDPRTVPRHLQAPTVVIESLTVDHVERRLDQAVRITPGQDNVEIAYTAPSLVDPDQIQFKYQLAGLDRDWVTASTRRTAYYAHLPAGEYDFKVIAANSDGAWNSREAKLHLSVLPRFYETSWFEWLTAVACTFLLILSWRLRTQRFERATSRQRAISGQLIASQESERKRIAAELHDSLGQHLLMIKNWAALAMREVGGSARQQSLTQISDAASSAIQEVREISYNLRPVQLERLGLTTAIKDLVQQVAGSSEINFTARIASVDGAFAPDAEMSIYRICQESLNNIVRHSQASEANICLDRHDDRVDIVIGDNGRGFSPAENRGPEPGNGGFGLLGIAERVRMLGGRWSVVSSPGSGTVISISLKPRREHS